MVSWRLQFLRPLSCSPDQLLLWLLSVNQWLFWRAHVEAESQKLQRNALFLFSALLLSCILSSIPVVFKRFPTEISCLSRARCLHMILCSFRNSPGIYYIKNAWVCHAKLFTAMWPAHIALLIITSQAFLIITSQCLCNLKTFQEQMYVYTIIMSLYNCKIRLYVHNRTVFIGLYKSHCNYSMHSH